MYNKAKTDTAQQTVSAVWNYDLKRSLSPSSDVFAEALGFSLFYPPPIWFWQYWESPIFSLFFICFTQQAYFFRAAESCTRRAKGILFPIGHICFSQEEPSQCAHVWCSCHLNLFQHLCIIFLLSGTRAFQMSLRRPIWNAFSFYRHKKLLS